MSIYVVEDEPKLAALLADYLQAAGYTPRCIDNGESALAILRDEPCPALVLLDIMLPGIDGMAVCRALRQFSTVPVIMITARVEEIDRLLGLELGADDYICKPFSPREVVARVQALLRRGQWLVSNAVDGSGENSDAELVLDRDTMSGRVGSRALELTPIEFRLLEVLTDRRGRVFSRDQLLDRAYEDHRVVTDRTIDSHIKNLRRKLEAVMPDEQPIRSVYGVGYKFDG